MLCDLSVIFPLAAGAGKQLETKESEARLVEVIPCIRLTENEKKKGKNLKQDEAESDTHGNALCVLKHR